MMRSSISAILRERASLQSNDTAFTFLDYDKDWEGVPESLTWSQVYQRTRNLATELRAAAAVGDRAVILAPQGLEYVIAFLASLEAGVIAVPLSTPAEGHHDERVTAVMRDATPTVIFTTSGIVENVSTYAVAQADQPPPTVFEVDRMDLDSRRKITPLRQEKPETAYLQYTSGSTRTPAGVMMSSGNLSSNFEQMTAGLFPDEGRMVPPGTTSVSWLPFYHDMGLMLAIAAPILGGFETVFMTPIAFLQRPARWIQHLARHTRTVTAAPNFAYELALARTKDEDLEGLDLGDVSRMISGAERVHVSTIKRFVQRFARFNFPEDAIRPSYGLAEATLYVATNQKPGAQVANFEADKLSDGHAERCQEGTALVSYGRPDSPKVRIVDPDTSTEKPAGEIGEIWVQGDNVALGYWGKPKETEHTFHANLAGSSAAAPGGFWLRTGDLGFVSDGELFIIGRMKDLLIVRGRNHYPDDIEATVQARSGGRVAAISVPDAETEKLVVVVEFKKGNASEEEFQERIRILKDEVTAAISQFHELAVGDIVIVPPGSIPITTSGKIRRSGCVEKYEKDEFARLG